MAHVYVAVITAAGRAERAVQAIRDLPEVTEAHIVAGDFDVMVELDAPEVSDLLPIVTQKLQAIEGVGTTRTYISLS